MWRRVLLVTLLGPIAATGGCAECQADCAGPEIAVELAAPEVVSVELCQDGTCETRRITEVDGVRSAWFPVSADASRRVRVSVATLDGGGAVLMSDTFDGELPTGDCGCDVGTLELRADDARVSAG